MFHGVPMGYVIVPNGAVAFDPDEQAQSVVRLVFDKFDEIGSIYGLMHDLVRNRVALPIRGRCGAKKVELEWRRPTLSTLCQLLHHPIYAGAYAFGRRPLDPLPFRPYVVGNEGRRVLGRGTTVAGPTIGAGQRP